MSTELSETEAPPGAENKRFPSPLQRRQLARYDDWQRPAWCAMNNRECQPFVALGYLETRFIDAYRSVACEYRLTAAGAALLDERTPDA